MKRGIGGKRVTNADLAVGVGVSTTTVSAWLNDRGPEGPKRETLAKVAAFLDVPVGWLEHGDLIASHIQPAKAGVVREPSPSSMPRPLQIIAAEYEVEALKAGADEDDMRYIRMALRSQEAIELFHGGYVEPMSVADQRVEMESVVAMLRLWLAARIQRRAQKS